MRDDNHLETEIAQLLADAQYEGHPLRAALAELFQSYHNQLSQLERITTISDGFQSVLRTQNQSLAERYRKQIRQLQKIVRISDHYQKMLQDMNETLKVSSLQDPLTGLANRRSMMERLKAEAALSERNRQPCCLALIDIDHFKRINDQFGHDIGDIVLVDTARTLAAGLRPYDFCARWGGEEFMVLLPQAPGTDAVDIVNRLRLMVDALPHAGAPGKLQTTVSAGVAEHPPGTDIADTIKRADLALYEAKHAGRNCVRLAEMDSS